MTNQAILTLGILETGLVSDELKAKHGSYPDMFCTLLSAEKPTLIYKHYNVIDGEYPSDIDECDAYLITGSKSNSYDEDPWIVTLKQYIRTLVEHKKKLLGICFGHQVIAHALGGLAGKSDKGWGVGVYTSQVTSNLNLPWLDEQYQDFNLLVSHQDQVLKLPNNATLLAGNSFCPNAAYFIGDQVLSFQGHPEFTHTYARCLLEVRRAIISEEVCFNAIESYAKDTDHRKVARWMLNFIG